MKTITFAALKGGVGKTTNSILVANNLAARGFKVLFFELDIQNNSASMFYTKGIEDFQVQLLKKNNFEVLANGTVEPFTMKTKIPNVDLVPNTTKMKKINPMNPSDLKNALKSVESLYDYVIIDTCPYYNMILLNALVAADYILSPTHFDDWDLATLHSLEEEILSNTKNQGSNWYIFYSEWSTNLARFQTSIQTRWAETFENEFNNILDIKIPATSAAKHYTQSDEKLSVTSSSVLNRTLAQEINKLVNMITGEEKIVEKF